MRTLFLLTVLFVLLAFAFKKPDQSAWDFAQQLSVNVASKVGNQVDAGSSNDYGQKIERKVMEKFSVIRKKIKDADESVSTPETKKTNEDLPKPIQPKLVKQQDDQPKFASGDNSSSSKTIRNSELQNFNRRTSSIRNSQSNDDKSLAPIPTAQPVESVSVEPLATPNSPKTTSTNTVPIDGAELVEIGARFERASRWLSEIK
jgi:hypothetical protein